MPTKLYDADWVSETVGRLADEIHANRAPGRGRALVGLPTRGSVLAARLGAALEEAGSSVQVGALDPTMHRDDLHTGSGLKPLQGSNLTFDINDLTVILVDDVLYTGRTIRAAMDALFSYGRPACVRLCVMLDRGGRELPVQPDFSGAHVDVPAGAYVRLKLSEVDAPGDAVYVVGAGEEEPA